MRTMEAENSRGTRKSARLPDVGRPRIRPPGENTVLSFKVTDEFIDMLDKAAEQLTRERPPGSSRVSRTEAIKILLAEALTARAERSTQSRQS
jgi:hypothetical protein